MDVDSQQLLYTHNSERLIEILDNLSELNFSNVSYKIKPFNPTYKVSRGIEKLQYINQILVELQQSKYSNFIFIAMFAAAVDGLQSITNDLINILLFESATKSSNYIIPEFGDYYNNLLTLLKQKLNQ